MKSSTVVSFHHILFHALGERKTSCYNVRRISLKPVLMRNWAETSRSRQNLSFLCVLFHFLFTNLHQQWFHASYEKKQKQKPISDRKSSGDATRQVLQSIKSHFCFAEATETQRCNFFLQVVEILQLKYKAVFLQNTFFHVTKELKYTWNKVWNWHLMSALSN